MSAFAMYYQAVLKSDIIGLQKALEEFEKTGTSCILPSQKGHY